jgi:hypothetical protein
VILFVCVSILLNMAQKKCLVFLNILLPNVNRCDCSLMPHSTRLSKFGGCSQLLVYHIPNDRGPHLVRRLQLPPSVYNAVLLH